MTGRLKEAYSASEALGKNIWNVCELGSRYDAMDKKVWNVRLSLEVEKDKSVRLEHEKRSLEVTMKEALEKRDNELASAWKEANHKTKAAGGKLKSVAKLKEEK
ncbi:uncharacterized protein LOC123401838 [Hordeum vulgare subsp. vulgare]|uniref:uncharacterized protein LOC123401838 n=1 Tax=Hordeum vulgare subsp. vulgare TaxID=112509 RepID=UPI001D1A4163|nr:uncharacterized protein LOC123401838 [Hordeum vulgare subsp. vulgare]